MTERYFHTSVSWYEDVSLISALIRCEVEIYNARRIAEVVRASTWDDWKIRKIRIVIGSWD